MTVVAGRSRPPPRAGGWEGGVRRALQALGAICHALLGPTDAGQSRQDVIRRAFVAGVIVAVLPFQQVLPGWEGVVGGCACALVYDVPLFYLVFIRKEYFVARVLGTVLDSIVLMGASFFVFREMGAQGSASDIWLVFFVYVVTGGFTMAPLGSLLYTALWITWFAFGTLLYFPDASQYHEQLAMRMIFLGVIGISALGVASELNKRRDRLLLQNRQTIGMLAKLVEGRDTDAGMHLQNIQHYSRALALHLGLSRRDADEIAYASMVHDVGKANVPDAVLKKDGPLDRDEWSIMQAHTRWGEELLTENSDFEMAREVARWHHERWDGTGYPDGLSGEDIPFVARIAAVADVYDALISKRPYKDSWPAERAIAELRRLAGSHLDPEIVGAFCELWERGEIRRISEELGTTPDEDYTLDRAA
jgi:HD-GYP domain-containing protein (c-di-GMP phosphodiesterase class II)